MRDGDKRLIESVSRKLGLEAKLEDDYVQDSAVTFDGWITLLSPEHPDTQDADGDGKWVVYYDVVVPGVSYTRNGDGWPDNVDVADVGSYARCQDAMIAVAGLAAMRLIETEAENQMHERMHEQEGDHEAS